MKIVIDDKIPFVRGVLEPWAEVLYLPGGEIDTAAVRDADALVVRTRTRCDRTLLEDSQVGIVATATIGYDHIDTAYCREKGIRVATAAGCNARGVAQWVFAALQAMDRGPQTGVLGIIGVGNVGNVVREVAFGAGFQVICCDPPRAAAESPEGFVTQQELLARADIITVHVPLDETTRGMVSEEFLQAARPGAVLLNSSRGEVVDETALKVALGSGRVSAAALDVWRHEPEIDRQLLAAVNIATPHIAGYTLQGKAMGTAMSVRAVARFLGLPLPADWYPAQAPRQHPRVDLLWRELTARMPHYYDIRRDDAALRRDPAAFEQLRSDYRFREEFF